ncbi:hypothetical protein LWC34_01105 [Kibdelosporangium philippinense]|uniref:Uncharacterized protein n=1 Tax=Kibdelosporangium philippinense TaxID=211113 RepID=A0ABS8Z0D9_9PSEU|nr:hypothetical protein [Kibdelosporangium philippinense]MCE7001444.1 hypothetical protein [Kibdelosporangium philippinense]
MLSDETIAVVKNQSEKVKATSPRDGSNISTGTLCGIGSTYHAAADLRAPDLFIYAGPWTE